MSELDVGGREFISCELTVASVLGPCVMTTAETENTTIAKMIMAARKNNMSSAYPIKFASRELLAVAFIEVTK